MAHDVLIAGALFPDVPSVQFPDSQQQWHSFTDVSDTTAAAADVAQGKQFYDAAGTLTQGTASGSSVEVDALSVTANGTYTAPTGHAYSPVTVNVSGGGGGIGTLLHTESLGHCQTTSTSAVEVKSFDVSGVNPYDLLIVETSIDTLATLRFIASTSFVLLLDRSYDITTKYETRLANEHWMCSTSGSNTQIETKRYTSCYGVYLAYVSSVVTSGTITLNMSMRRSSAYASTVNGDFTTRVYGVSLYDLIGG